MVSSHDGRWKSHEIDLSLMYCIKINVLGNFVLENASIVIESNFLFPHIHSIIANRGRIKVDPISCGYASLHAHSPLASLVLLNVFRN